REIEVVADPARLAQQGMTFDELAAAIREATTVAAVGRMPMDYRQYLMVSATEAHSADDIANVVVGHGLRARDLAKVTPAPANRAASIPLTLVITIVVMWLFGQTFNLMTLGAMAIAIGLVIDDAVVITENIVRHLDLNPDRTAAIRDAVQELLWPVTTSTLTTVVVFLPLGLLQGVVGQFFHALSITL